MSFQEVKYKMKSLDNSLHESFFAKSKGFLLHDPKNWDESEKTLKRSTKTFGIITELSKDLQFSKEGAEFLRIMYSTFDIEAQVKLEEWRAYPDKDGFYLHSEGLFDFSGYKTTEHFVNIPFKTGGLNAQIKAQLKEKFELERLDSLDGVELDPLEFIDVALTPREIFLLSKLEIDTSINDGFYTERYWDDGFSSTTPYRSPILMIQADGTSDPRVQFVIDDFVAWNTGGSQWEQVLLDVQNYFYYNNDVSKTIRVSGEFEVRLGRSGDFIIDAAFVVTDENNDYVSHQVVYNEVSLTENSWRTISFNDIDIILEENENIAFVVNGGYSYGGASDPGLYYRVGRLTISQDSYYPPSNSKGIFFHEAFDRIMQIITSEQSRFVSDFYGREDIGYPTTQEYALTALLLGFWIRKFDDEKIEVSLKDLIEASNAIHNTGYTVENYADVEKLVVEDMKYFFQRGIGIVIPNQVSNVTRKAASEFHYANLTFGYNKPSGDNLYEEAMGLDEYNTQNSYTLPITRVDNKYSKISPFRADSYGKEFARRKPQLDFPEQDTRFDREIFLADLKETLGDSYAEREWADDYESAPENVYSPDSATNLRLTPFRNSERHQWFYGSGVSKFASKSVRYANSIGNSNLITDKVDEPARAENGDLLISELERPRFTNMWIEFEFPVDYDLNQQIYGFTDVAGRKTPNYFHLVEFINEFGEKEYGYLFELKPNKEGKWKLLKAY